MSQAQVSPERFLEIVTSYQRTAAIKTAVELDIFSAIGSGATSASDIARACAASERGVRMLCDFLTVLGLITKDGPRYGLTPDAAVFLDRRSPAYLGGITQFLLSPGIVRNFDHLTETVRRGAPAPSANTVSEENPVWVEFARAMMPMMAPGARAIAELIDLSALPAARVLDIAAGHGVFGIAFATRYPNVSVTAVDWPDVLEVATEHAVAAGVGGRHRTIAGDAFHVPFGSGFDVALITNFLHHFDKTTCTSFLRKVGDALRPGGRVAVLEFVPNDDRVSPMVPASFVMNMLAGTPAGDAYTLAELTEMLTAAGFGEVDARPLPMPELVVVGTRP